jgi:hypothetical protein
MMRAKIKCVARWPGGRQLKEPYHILLESGKPQLDAL